MFKRLSHAGQKLVFVYVPPAPNLWYLFDLGCIYTDIYALHAAGDDGIVILDQCITYMEKIIGQYQT